MPIFCSNGYFTNTWVRQYVAFTGGLPTCNIHAFFKIIKIKR